MADSDFVDEETEDGQMALPGADQTAQHERTRGVRLQLCMERCCRSIVWVKYSLFAMNFLVSVGGLIMLAVGVWVRLERQKLGPLDSMTTDPAYMLISLGAVMFTITIPGYMGALRESTCLLKTFCLIIALTFVFEVISGVVAFAFMGHIRLNMLTYFHQSLITYQDNPDVQGAVDYIQQQYRCCGASTYQDWESNIYYNCSSPALSKCGVPWSCCKSFHGNVHCGFNTRNLQDDIAQDLVYTTGCIYPLIGSFRDDLIAIGMVAFGIGLTELVSIILANVMIRDITLRKIKQAHETTLFNMREKNYKTMDP